MKLTALQAALAAVGHVSINTKAAKVQTPVIAPPLGTKFPRPSGDFWIRNSMTIAKSQEQARADYEAAQVKRARKEMKRLADAGLSGQELI